MNAHSTVEDKPPHDGLKVLILGAGIGGLAAAIALRQQGHDVELFERSRFANGVGAAIHLTPNASGLLKRIGIDAVQYDAVQYGAVRMEYIREFTLDGEIVSQSDINEFADKWQHEWLLIHRAHLHEALKAKAQASGKGQPAVLHTQCKVAGIDPHAATLTLEDGRIVQGNVVIGADGVHSVTRRQVPGGDVTIFSFGKNAFRFMVSRKEVLDDPETADMFRVHGIMDLWNSDDSRIIIYPCVNNEVLNFVCIHPDTLTNIGVTTGWKQSVGKSTLLDIYNSFSPTIQRVLDKADPETLKVWPLVDMETLPSWVNNRFTLMGDAAHPFLPYRASGGAMALEDGLSLAVMLSGTLKREDLPERLKLYEKARSERVTRIQDLTRDSGRRHMSVGEASNLTSCIYDHDEWDHSTQLLWQYLWAQTPNVYYRQPTVFGPMPGPCQDLWGGSRAVASTKATFRTASIKVKTSRTLLRNLLPTPAYRFTGTGSVAYATLSQTTLDELDWLTGAGYNHFGLYIHGVEYKQSDGEVTRGTYLPVLLEDLTDPIISGREELGSPKAYSNIDVDGRYDSCHVTASWPGAVWGRMSLIGLSESQESQKALEVHLWMDFLCSGICQG